jgi:hypothetical protein
LPLLVQPTQHEPNFESDMVDNEKDGDDNGVAATKILRDQYNELLPRWKGVVLTSEAELEAKDNDLPWVNIKFAQHWKDSEGNDKYQDAGVPAWGEHMSVNDQVKYKYLIDLAGGGGTTWTGTAMKLAMPGLLMHHVTPMKDYFYDRIKPYVHYVPVASDLSDLKEKFEWAESNPEMAKRISDRGTEFMRYLGTEEGFGQFYEEEFTQPLRRIIDAYQPVSKTHPGKTWKEIIEAKMAPVYSCFGNGYARRQACVEVNEEQNQKWEEMGLGYWEENRIVDESSP